MSNKEKIQFTLFIIGSAIIFALSILMIIHFSNLMNNPTNL